MEKQRGTIVAVVAALVIAVISLGVAFAAFSTNLYINGTATVEATTWDIYFSNSSASGKESTYPATITDKTESNTVYSGSETVTATGSITSATEVTWNASFKTAGDKVVYHFYVHNDGDFAAEVSNNPASEQVGVTNFSCTSDSAAETSVCAHIHYGLYEDAAGTTPVASGLTLAAKNGVDDYYLIAWLDEDTPIAADDVTTATITTTVTYEQTGVAQ